MRPAISREIAAADIMHRDASVVWEGSLREGAGTITTESGVLADTQYSFCTRFAEGIGTNPDELIAASLGGCFAMALANELDLSGFHPERIETTATATMENLAAGWDPDTHPTRGARERSERLASPFHGRRGRSENELSHCPFAQGQHLHDRESRRMIMLSKASTKQPRSVRGRNETGNR